MKTPRTRQARGKRILAAVAVLPLTATLALTGVTPAAADVTLPDPAVLYTFDQDPSAATVRNEGALGAAFDARVRNATSLARGTGPTTTLGASGVFPGAAQGTSRDIPPYLEIPAGLFQNTTAMTVSTWIKWNGANASQLPWAYIVGSDALPADNWGIYFVPNEGNQSKAVANSGTEVKAVAPSPLPSGQWVQLTSVTDGSSLSYYLNGSLVRTEAVTLDYTKLSATGSTRSGLIGRVPWAGPWAAFFGGEFDNFAVYKQALSAEQVAHAFQEQAGQIVSVAQESFQVSTAAGVAPALPASVNVTRASGITSAAMIRWDQVPPSAYAQAGASFTVQGTVDGWATPLVAQVTVAARPTQAVVADFAQDTGAFRGGASGTLYGLGDEGSPTQALVNGSAITNTSQKPPYGTQHPGGDAFNIEETFFRKHGKDLYIYTQDYYPDWPYNGGVRPGDNRSYVRGEDGVLTGEYTLQSNGLWDYLEVLEIVVDAVARESDNPEKYIFIPFNEVDLQWLNTNDKYNRYMHLGGQPDSYTPGGATDWAAAWKVITDTYARHGLARPKIAGPGDAAWRGEANIKAFLNSAIASNTVPDIYVWHELRGYQWLPDRVTAYQNYARQVGLTDAQIPEVNITEWGASSDMSSPANLLRWFASFEAAKVDAQTAYWTASGTLSDNQAKVNAGNGGWWLFKWYGDLMGSRTVRVTTGQQNAIAAVDRDAQRAQVIVGGITEGQDAALTLNGLDAATFGSSVDVEVRELLVSGTDGIASTPRVVAAFDSLAVQNGSVQLRVPSRNASSAYQVIFVPAASRDVEAGADAQPERHLLEAEAATLTNAQVRTPSGYRASGDRDVSGFSQVGSRADWTVQIQDGGLYRLQVLGATPGAAAQHALFVDDAFSTTVQYGANAIKPNNVRTVARGSAEVLVALPAGAHNLSLRASRDGVALLPGAGNDGGLTLDRFELVRVGDTVNAESVEYPATTFRIFGDASLRQGAVRFGQDGRADLYASTYESGYYDIAVSWTGSTMSLVVNGREAATLTGTAGANSSVVRVHLPEGITEIELHGSDGSSVSTVTTTRAVAGDARIVKIEAEDLGLVQLGGTAGVSGFGSALTNGSGDGYVKGLGITDANPANEGTLTVPRVAGIDKAGAYNAVVHYSNDDIEGTHDYNPQVVDLGLQASEAGTEGLVGRTTFRYTYTATNFWEAVMALDLDSDGGAITFGNTKPTLYIDEGPTGSTSDDQVLPGYAIAPDVDWIAFAPFVIDAGDPEVQASATATTRCVAGKVALAVTVTNGGDVALDIASSSSYGTKAFAALAPGKSASHAFSTRAVSIGAGTVALTATPADGGAGELSFSAPYDAKNCG
ncbi:MAG TPA: Ig-like domain-containing protein [Arachnia sp.]|nr:Ig-like domain-containing protein [Arachnia sp.]HMT87195.1 Ig-like domain-containing protein [Arachnia sp.]